MKRFISHVMKHWHTVIVLKAFAIAFVFAFFVQSSVAQNEPTHSISELKILLQKKTVDSVRVNLLLEMAMVYIWKAGMEKNDFDSALSFVNQAKNISLHHPLWLARCFHVYSQLYREGNQKEKGKQYLDTAITILTRYDRKEALASVYEELRNYYNIYSDAEWAYTIRYTEKAEQLYRESGSKLKQAETLKHLGDLYQVRKQDSISLKRLEESLAIYKQLRYEKVQGVYDLMGCVYYNRTDYQNALKYGLLAVETAERLKTGGQELSTIYNRIGLTYYRLTKYPEANKYFTQAFSVALNNKDTISTRQIAPNIIDTWLRLQNQQALIHFLEQTKFMAEKESLRFKEFYYSSYVKAYLLTGDYKKAERYVKELKRLVNDSSSISVRSMLYRAVIPYYLAAGQYKEMYKYLPHNESILKQWKIMSGLADNYLWWYKADSALGKLGDAIVHHKLYKEASDSSLRLTASQQINQLLIQHETYKKDQEIAAKENNIALLTDKTKLQEYRLKQTRLVRNLSYGLASLLLLVVALLYSRYRLKQQSNNKLQEQQREINEKNKALLQALTQKEKLLVEKEWLLKEVHHRVKNNMHIVMSLLNLQANYIDNEMALSAIHESEHRLQAMSLIHQKLYNSDNVSSIEMPVYIRELVSYLADSFTTGKRIQFDLSVEPVEMDVSQVVPLGLILNEAITNAIKYAFPNERNGVIKISLSTASDRCCVLLISDNGVGIPSGDRGRRSGSMGMELMEGLAGDLEGSFSVDSSNGTTIRISFVQRMDIKRPDVTAVSVA